MKITDEQEAIASSRAKSLVVNAFAGTGKTSTLVEYARRRPQQTLTYLAFNRAIKEEAQRKFPSNVRCVTTHGLAYSGFGSQYSDKLGNLRASNIAKAFNLTFMVGGLVLQIVNNFIASKSELINETHLGHAKINLNNTQESSLIDFARATWERMKNTSDKSILMTHDGYLKLYQLSKPQIKTDIILFDEAQDANPVTLDIVINQRANKVFVGDKYQAIYGFRGAIDALDNIDADERLLLTSSFRFGQGTADVASGILQDWQQCKHRIVGRGAHDTVFKVNQSKAHAIISRTNACLFNEAVYLTHAETPFGFVGGVENYKFDTILDVYKLFSGDKKGIKDQFIGAFESYESMEAYGTELDDKEVKALLRVVDEYRHDIPALISDIKAKGSAEKNPEAVILTTAHKSKGLEFDSVILTSDYTDLAPKQDKKTGKMVMPTPEEINILYVALTRSIRCVALPDSVKQWLKDTDRLNLLSIQQPQCKVTTTEKQAAIEQKALQDFDTLEAATSCVVEQFKTIEIALENIKKATEVFPELRSIVALYLADEAKKLSGPAVVDDGNIHFDDLPVMDEV